MRIPILNLDAVGVVADTSAQVLPLPAFTDIRNMRVQDGALESISGHAAFSPQPTVAPKFLAPFAGPTERSLIYSDFKKVYNYALSGDTNITRQTAGVDVDYSGSYMRMDTLNGVPVLTDGVAVPQMWLPSTIVTKLSDLSNWPATYTAATVRAFKNFLIALDITKAGTRYPSTVLWSHPADPGTVPVSWDITDATKDAGEYALSDTEGVLVDCKPLRDVNIVYKENSMYAMRYVGGTQIFAFTNISSEAGMAAPDAMASFEYNGAKQVILTTADVVIYDGQNLASLLNKRMRKWLFGSIASGHIGKSCVVANSNTTEIWICFCDDSSGLLTRALIWNWVTNTFTTRALPNLHTMKAGVVPPTAGGDSWQSDSLTWNADTNRWQEALYSAERKQLIGGSSSGGNNMFLFNATNSFNGAPMESIAERQSLAVAGLDKQGNPMIDTEVVKLVTEVWPRIRSVAAQNIEVYVGTQMHLDDAIQWAGPYDFNTGTDVKINCLATGRFISVRFRAVSSISWKLLGYDLELQPVGRY